MGINRELILIMAVMAVMGAIGILTLFGGIMGIAVLEKGVWTVMGMLSGLSGILFGIILLLYIRL